MARHPCNFRQKDVTRVLKGARAAGYTVERLWVEKDGRIVLGIINGKEHTIEREIENEAADTWEDVA